MKKTDDVRAAIAALSGIPPVDYCDAVDREQEFHREKRVALRRAEEAAAGQFKIVKRYVRSQLRLGKYQRVDFHGGGITILHQKKWMQVCTIHMTIHTGVGGAEIHVKWRAEDLTDLDRKLAAVRDALAAIRME